MSVFHVIGTCFINHNLYLNRVVKFSSQFQNKNPLASLDSKDPDYNHGDLAYTLVCIKFLNQQFRSTIDTHVYNSISKEFGITNKADNLSVSLFLM